MVWYGLIKRIDESRLPSTLMIGGCVKGCKKRNTDKDMGGEEIRKATDSGTEKSEEEVW